MLGDFLTLAVVFPRLISLATRFHDCLVCLFPYHSLHVVFLSHMNKL